MIYVDSHVHSRNSSDGRDPVAEIVREAEEKGLAYLATTDHLDLELKYGGNHSPLKWKHIDLDAYYAEWQAAKAALDEKGSPLEFRFGIEAGFGENVCDRYLETFEKYPFDVVINSVHFVGGWDVYFPHAFLFKRKKKVYGEYLDNIIKSLDAPYHYDIVAHIGYVTRNAPYRDKSLCFADFPDKFERILKGIIDRGKALEINTHTNLYPAVEIIEKYYEYGGRKISFGSDSHHAELCKDFDATSAMLKEIGFTNFTVFEGGGKEKQIPIG